MYFKTSNSKSNIISFDVLSGVRLETEIWVTLRASFELSHFSSGLLMSTLWYMQRILIAERKFNFFKVCNWACRAVHFPTEILSVTLSPFSMFSWNMINFAESCCFFLYPIACGRVILIKSQNSRAHPRFRHKQQARSRGGGSRIFFRRGCTRLLFNFNTNKPHSFFGRIPVVLENRRSSQGGGVHPLHPPPRSAYDLISYLTRKRRKERSFPQFSFFPEEFIVS